MATGKSKQKKNRKKQASKKSSIASLPSVVSGDGPMAKSLARQTNVVTNQGSKFIPPKTQSLPDMNFTDKDMFVLQQAKDQYPSLFAAHPKKDRVDRLFARFDLKNAGHQAMLAELVDANSTGKLQETVERWLLPDGALYANEIAPPAVFAQNGNIFIDQVNADIKKNMAEPLFWWQPINDPLTYAAFQPLVEWMRTYDPKVARFSLGNLKPQSSDSTDSAATP